MPTSEQLRRDMVERQIARRGIKDDHVIAAMRDVPRERVHPEAREALMEPRLERYIAVIYRPETERLSHYSGAALPRRLDAWVWFDETHAVTPLPTRQIEGAEETYPFGL